MHILALDTATHTGWAHSNGQRGCAAFEPKRGESPGMRWIKFRAWLISLLEKYPTELIVYELEGTARSRAAAHVAHGLTSAVETIAADRDIEITNVSPKTLKKWATGNGNAPKHEMINAAERIVRCPIEDDNEADAVLLLAYAKELYDVGGADRAPGG